MSMTWDPRKSGRYTVVEKILYIYITQRFIVFNTIAPGAALKSHGWFTSLLDGVQIDKVDRYAGGVSSVSGVNCG